MGVCLSTCFAAPLLKTRNEVGNIFINVQHEESCGHQVNFTVNDSCQFYEQCIDQHFPCREFGFTMWYAARRCQAILNVHQEESLTFSSAHIHHWTMLHETCLRRKLLHLLQAFTNSSKPDQPVCLQMETLAFKAVEECYNETQEKFCPSESDGETFELNDSLLLVQLFSLNDSYYAHTVKQGLSKLYRTCNHSSLDVASTDLENRAPQRAVICAINSESDIFSTSKAGTTSKPLLPGGEYVKNVSILQKIPAEQLIYGGHVLPSEGGECFRSGPVWLRDKARVHLILWSVPPQQEVEYPLDNFVYYTQDEFFELWSSVGYHSEGECGDGIRQATEMCDVGAFSGLKYACTADCQSWEGFECFGDPLTRATCKKQMCGDGKRTSDEECDDNNGVSNDGCSSVCRAEPGWNCTDDYLQQSKCTQTPTITTPTPTTPSSPTTNSIVTPPVNILDRNSAEVASKHLLIVVVSVLVALVVSNGLSSALPGTTGNAAGSGTHDNTSGTEHDQRRKSEEVLVGPERPCWDETGDYITWCMPHKCTTVSDYQQWEVDCMYVQ